MFSPLYFPSLGDLILEGKVYFTLFLIVSHLFSSIWKKAERDSKLNSCRVKRRSVHAFDPSLHIISQDPSVAVSIERGKREEGDGSYSSTSREMNISIYPKSKKASYE